jgi:coenzyme F420 hydrogenase subunit beta
MSSEEIIKLLREEVIKPGLCSHCGTCVGLSKGTLRFRESNYGPLPEEIAGGDIQLDDISFDACPGRGQNYPSLNRFVFGREPDSWLMGCYQKIYLGYSNDPQIRRAGASGGVLTHLNLHLLKTGRVDGCIVLQHACPKPWLSTAVIARSEEEILNASQSVYIPTPVNTILAEMDRFDGRLGYVGLPDQVSSLRRLQQLGHPAALKVQIILGPYVGTSFYLGAIRSFLRSHKVNNLDEVVEMRYREGEWPGYLRIRTSSGVEIRAKKFYYNYLIPFYITRTSLLSVDFTNELADVSVGDAWHPSLEREGRGYSVIVARSKKGEKLLDEMRDLELLDLKEISADEALSMHAHMIDFKKRGTFIRLGWRKSLGLSVPDYGYHPVCVPLSRKLVELIISGLFLAGRTSFARKIIEVVPTYLVGRVFEHLRIAWKNISKGTKRRGLRDLDFRIEVES